MEWKFDKISPQTTKVDPAHLEFFRSEALEDAVSALVREDIQNRLDAKRKDTDKPVKVRYYLSGRKSRLDPYDSREWLKGLHAHLNAPKCLQEIASGPIKLERPMPYLVLEDFNTTGLKGDPKVTTDPEADEDRNDFYWFVRNVGRTGKKAGDRGRWGLGKIVYPASSSIRSFFCYSVRQGDNRPTLIGRSVLAIHAINGAEYHSEGYYALYPDKDLPYYALPQDDSEVISKFADTFNISRKPNESGLSLVIPFPDESITENTLVLSTIRHYFWEILRGALEVEVAGDRGSTVISNSTIDDVVMSWSGLDDSERKVTQRRLEFCRKADRMKLTDPDGYYELSEPSSYGSSRVANLFKTEEQLEAAKRRFRGGEVVAAEFVVSVKKHLEASSNETSFLVYLQRDPELDSADETYIRDGLTVIGESRLREPGIRALILAEDPTISEFLGDAENPAHTRWLHTTKHFRGKYKPGKVLLEYIKLSALRLANLLGKVEDELLEDLLDDVFGIPDPEKGKPREKASTPKPGTKKPPKGGVKRKRYIETRRLEKEAGFVVRLSSKAQRRPDRIVIRVAHDSEHGDPFKQYHPADFDLTDKVGSINITTTHVNELSRGPNRAVFELLQDDFTIKLAGFDRNRDLRIDVRPESDKSEGEDDV